MVSKAPFNNKKTGFDSIKKPKRKLSVKEVNSF